MKISLASVSSIEDYHQESEMINNEIKKRNECMGKTENINEN